MTNVDSLQAQADLLTGRNVQLSDDNAKLREQRDALIEQIARDQAVIQACIAESAAREAFEQDETALTQAAFNEAVTRRRHAMGQWSVDR